MDNNINNAIIEGQLQESSQWSPFSENSTCQQNKEQQDIKINENKIKIYNELCCSNQNQQQQISVNFF